jgi:hypothetical protein
MGIVLLPLGALVFGLYLWAVVKGTRWAYRKFSRGGAIAAMVFFALLPTWDALINHYYYKLVLCRRPEVSVQIYQRIALPQNLYDEKGKPKLPDSFGDPKRPFLGKYIFDIHYKNEGSYPITANRHLYHGIYDVTTNKYLSKFEDYQPAGGWIWTNIFRLVLNATDYAWLMSRGQKQSCFDQTQFWKNFAKAKTEPFAVKF